MLTLRFFLRQPLHALPVRMPLLIAVGKRRDTAGREKKKDPTRLPVVLKLFLQGRRRDVQRSSSFCASYARLSSWVDQASCVVRPGGLGRVVLLLAGGLGGRELEGGCERGSKSAGFQSIKYVVCGM